MESALPDVRVAGPPGAPVGFYMLKDDELYQLYVAAQARGSGVATVLMADAETRLVRSAAFGLPGSRAPSGTIEPLGSTRSPDGAVPAPSYTRPRHPTAHCPWRSGVTRSI